MEIIKVSAKSVPKATAGAIAAVIRAGEQAQVQAVGAGAINQAVKAIAISRIYLQQADMDIVCKPEFVNVTIGDSDRTAMQFLIKSE